MSPFILFDACYICMKLEPATVQLPWCMHTLCQTCFDAVRASKPATCPYCRKSTADRFALKARYDLIVKCTQSGRDFIESTTAPGNLIAQEWAATNPVSLGELVGMARRLLLLSAEDDYFTDLMMFHEMHHRAKDALREYAAKQADEQKRRVRTGNTLKHARVHW